MNLHIFVWTKLACHSSSRYLFRHWKCIPITQWPNNIDNSFQLWQKSKSLHDQRIQSIHAIVCTCKMTLFVHCMDWMHFIQCCLFICYACGWTNSWSKILKRNFKIVRSRLNCSNWIHLGINCQRHSAIQKYCLQYSVYSN